MWNSYALAILSLYQNVPDVFLAGCNLIAYYFYYSVGRTEQLDTLVLQKCLEIEGWKKSMKKAKTNKTCLFQSNEYVFACMTIN